MKIKLISLQVILVLIAGSSIYGQAGKIFTEADYKRAVEMLYGNVARFIDNDIQPQWLQDNRLWYCVKSGSKVEYRMFNPANGKILVGRFREGADGKSSCQSGGS